MNAVYSKLAIAIESATIICVLVDTKSGRAVGKHYSRKNERLQLCPDWRLLAQGSWKQDS